MVLVPSAISPGARGSRPDNRTGSRLPVCTSNTTAPTAWPSISSGAPSSMATATTSGSALATGTPAGTAGGPLLLRTSAFQFTPSERRRVDEVVEAGTEGEGGGERGQADGGADHAGPHGDRGAPATGLESHADARRHRRREAGAAGGVSCE